jgi:hypothetical protein
VASVVLHDNGEQGEPTKAPKLQPAEREVLSIAEACAASGLGRTKIHEAISDSNLRARKCGKRTLVSLPRKSVAQY